MGNVEMSTCMGSTGREVREDIRVSAGGEHGSSRVSSRVSGLRYDVGMADKAAVSGGGRASFRAGCQ